MDDVDRTTNRLLDEQSSREAAIAQAAIRPPYFGPCTDCDDEIDPERVAKLPWATRCTFCQTRFEAREKQYRRPL